MRVNRGLGNQITLVIDAETLAAVRDTMASAGVNQSEACRILLRRGARLKA